MSTAATNPLLQSWSTPFEASPFAAIATEHYGPAFEAAMAAHDAEIAAIAGNPAAPTFVQYINNRNFAIDPAAMCTKGAPKSPACAAAGDLSVEGLLFIPAASSSIGVPLLVASHETSDSVTVFRIDPAT